MARVTLRERALNPDGTFNAERYDALVKEQKKFRNVGVSELSVDLGGFTGGGTYTVKPGDSWFSIAGSTTGNQRNFESLMAENENISMLRPGMEITIPGLPAGREPTVSYAGIAAGLQASQRAQDAGATDAFRGFDPADVTDFGARSLAEYGISGLPAGAAAAGVPGQEIPNRGAISPHTGRGFLPGYDGYVDPLPEDAAGFDPYDFGAPGEVPDISGDNFTYLSQANIPAGVDVPQDALTSPFSGRTAPGAATGFSQQFSEPGGRGLYPSGPIGAQPGGLGFEGLGGVGEFGGLAGLLDPNIRAQIGAGLSGALEAVFGDPENLPQAGIGAIFADNPALAAVAQAAMEGSSPSIPNIPPTAGASTVSAPTQVDLIAGVQEMTQAMNTGAAPPAEIYAEVAAAMGLTDDMMYGGGYYVDPTSGKWVRPDGYYSSNTEPALDEAGAAFEAGAAATGAGAIDLNITPDLYEGNIIPAQTLKTIRASLNAPRTRPTASSYASQPSNYNPYAQSSGVTSSLHWKTGGWSGF